MALEFVRVLTSVAGDLCAPAHMWSVDAVIVGSLRGIESAMET